MVVSLHWIRPNLAFTITIFDLCDKSLHVIKSKSSTKDGFTQKLNAVDLGLKMRFGLDGPTN
ncbi:hypothetical protein ES288_A12G195900v1 [Gossypium darwinii]|uniref:Uncharacterized protein n=1 Tax=Gossypium darwinii TaxID=34276 RepID=A0A5D2EAQ2_GOSDA|nr:hypothetical protein ES288_A12G195900v1 [Gossypium darwinii]